MLSSMVVEPFSRPSPILFLEARIEAATEDLREAILLGGEEVLNKKQNQ